MADQQVLQEHRIALQRGFPFFRPDPTTKMAADLACDTQGKVGELGTILGGCEKKSSRIVGEK